VKSLLFLYHFSFVQENIMLFFLLMKVKYVYKDLKLTQIPFLKIKSSIHTKISCFGF